MAPSPQKVLLSGSSGFIGKAMHAALLQNGYEVATIKHADLKKKRVLKKIVRETQPDFILHFAAYGNMSMQHDNDEMIQANIMNLWNLLKATQPLNYCLFLNVSSSSVYGKTYKRMEEDDRLRPDTFYAATKAAGEHLCRAFRKQYKKNIVSVRPFTVYGPGEANFRFIPTLLKNGLDKKESTVIFGEHDYIYIDDFTRAILKIMEQYDSLYHRTFNIGTGIGTSNTELAEMIHKVNPISYRVIPTRKIQDSVKWRASIRRIGDINWQPTTPLEVGLQKCYEYYKK